MRIVDPDVECNRKMMMKMRRSGACVRIFLVALGVAAAGLFPDSLRVLGQVEPDLLQKAIDAEKKGDYSAAIVDYNQAIQLDPKKAELYFNRASAYSARANNNDDVADYNRAIADYSRAIQLDPTVTQSYVGRGCAYGAAGDDSRALADFNEAIQLDPKDGKAYYNRGLAYAVKDDMTQALADFNQAIQLDPNDADAYNNRGRCYGRKGDYDKALADFSQALRLNPMDAKTYYNRGGVDEAMGDFDKALTDFNRGLRLDSLDASAYVLRARAYKAKGDYARAVADCRHAVELDPQNVPAYNDLALLLAITPRADIRYGTTAVEYATKACELTEWKSPVTLDTLAAACAEAGDFDNAVKWESKVLQTPNLPETARAGAKSRLALYQAHQPYHTAQ